MLLSPERGLILNGTASRIVRLCTGANNVGMMIDHLADIHPDSARATLARDLRDFLHELERRGLLRETAS